MPLSERDRGNLYFLLYSDPMTIAMWLEQALPDEVGYALHILGLHKDEIRDKYPDIYPDATEDNLNRMERMFPDASKVIAKIKSNLDKPLTN